METARPKGVLFDTKQLKATLAGGLEIGSRSQNQKLGICFTTQISWLQTVESPHLLPLDLCTLFCQTNCSSSHLEPCIKTNLQNLPKPQTKLLNITKHHKNLESLEKKQLKTKHHKKQKKQPMPRGLILVQFWGAGLITAPWGLGPWAARSSAQRWRWIHLGHRWAPQGGPDSVLTWW